MSARDEFPDIVAQVDALEFKCNPPAEEQAQPVREEQQVPGDFRSRRGGIQHNKLARYLIDHRYACFVDGAPAVWDGAKYAVGWDTIDRATVGLADDAKKHDQMEVRHYLHVNAPRVPAADASFVAFENGVLDVSTGKLQPSTPTLVVPNVVSHEFDPAAYDETADAFLSSVSCGDAATRANLEEIIGLCLSRSTDYGVCPVLIGDGSNGKSTFLAALRNVLGEENTSALDLSVVGQRFQTGQLAGKLANLGDDISSEFLRADVLAVFKKLVTGEQLFTDTKGGDGFHFTPYCTLVFSANEFPRLGDAGEGVMRRLFPVPFEATFRPGEGNGFDPHLRAKLTTESAAKYLVRVGIGGLRRIEAQHGMTPNARSAAFKKEVRAENDTVLQWTEASGLAFADVEGRVVGEEYGEYRDWCEGAGVKACSQKVFTRKVRGHLGLASHPERREFAGGSRSVRVFRAAG